MADPEPEVVSNIPSAQETALSDPPIDDMKAQKMVSLLQSLVAITCSSLNLATSAPEAHNIY